MTCRELGGACDKVFKAETFEAMAKLSKQHGMEMYQAGDAAHIGAMTAMSEQMSDPDSMQQWLEEKQAEFDALP
ncbi:hypothetical protein BH09PAT2_BH09PAT2_08070 [soil metagenome]